MKVYIAADHAGFELKERLREYVGALGFSVIDCGAFAYNPDDDYPDFIRKAAEAVANNPQKSFGIVIGGSGQGEAMVANRYPHVRAAVYYGGNRKIVDLASEHNDANVLSLGARFVDIGEAKAVVRAWLLNHHSLAERHKERIEKIENVSREAAYLVLAQQRMDFLRRTWKVIRRRVKRMTSGLTSRGR